MANPDPINAPNFEEYFENFLSNTITEEYILETFIKLKIACRNSPIEYVTIRDAILKEKTLENISSKRKRELSTKINQVMGKFASNNENSAEGDKNKSDTIKIVQLPSQKSYDIESPNKKRKISDNFVGKNILQIKKRKPEILQDLRNRFKTIFLETAASLNDLQYKLHFSWLEKFFIDFKNFQEIYGNLNSIKDVKTLETHINHLHQLLASITTCNKLASDNPATFFYLSMHQSVSNRIKAPTAITNITAESDTPDKSESNCFIVP